jgi:hypothetical protein
VRFHDHRVRGIAIPTSYLRELPRGLAVLTRHLADPGRVLAVGADWLADPARCLAMPTRYLAVPARCLAFPAGYPADPTLRLAMPTGGFVDPTGGLAIPTWSVLDPAVYLAFPTRRVAHPARRLAIPTRYLADPARCVAIPMGWRAVVACTHMTTDCHLALSGGARLLLAGAFAVVATRPAAGPTLAFLELLQGSANAAFSRHLLPGILDPADELVTGQSRDVLPGSDRRRVGDQCFAQVFRKVVNHATGHSLVVHKTASSGPRLYLHGVCGAGEGIRTLDVHLGKVALYH